MKKNSFISISLNLIQIRNRKARHFFFLCLYI